MPFDPHKAARERYHLAIQVEALMREEAVVNFYAAEAKKSYPPTTNRLVRS